MPTQQETLQVYTALIQRDPDWRGKLLLSVGLHRPLALAALAAGAATLVLEDDRLLLQAARQDVTFTVHTLDEALRALKNEIRQGRAITVALTGDTRHWLDELNERGVQSHQAVTDANQFVTLTNHSAVILEDPATTLQQRRIRDAELIAAYPHQRRWLEAAPTLFPRDLTRAYLLENERLQPLP